MFKRICKITFITHGATVYSLNGIINDRVKAPRLNDIGEEELDKVCEYLEARGVAYDNIYTCPYTCCLESAQIIAKLFKQKPRTLDFLNRNHGVWNGVAGADLIKELGDDFISGTPENGESVSDFNKRVSSLIDKLIKENKGNRIIMVVTPEIVQAALAKTLKVSSKYQHRFLIKTGSLTQISYFEGWSSIIYSDYKPI